MTEYTALSAADEMLALNRLPGVIGVAAVCSGEPPEIGVLRSRVAERWQELPRMRYVLEGPTGSRLAGTGVSGRLRWAVRDAFDPAVQVRTAGAKVSELLADCAREPLPPGLPPWRVYLVRDGALGGDFAVVLVAQHALVDGHSLEVLLRSLLDDATPSRRPDPSGADPSGPAPGRERVGTRPVLQELRRLSAAGKGLPLTSARDAEPAIEVTDLDARVVHAARRQPSGSRGSTLNELLLGAATGAFRAHFGPPSQWPGRNAPVHAAVPVNLRTKGNRDELGNIVTAMRLPLPTGVPGADSRLRLCRERSAALPARGEVYQGGVRVFDAVARVVPWASWAFTARAHDPAFVASICTAFKWRGRRSSLHGKPLVRVVSLPPLIRPGSANFCLVQTGDRFTVTTVTHLGAGDAQLLAEAFTHEMQELAELAD